MVGVSVIDGVLGLARCSAVLVERRTVRCVVLEPVSAAVVALACCFLRSCYQCFLLRFLLTDTALVPVF